MSLSSQPPNLPEEAEANWAPAQHVAQVVPESAWSRFQVSRVRLIIAMAVAPLPLLLVHRRFEYYTWCCILSCFTLFGAVLWTRARDIPRLNLVVILMVAAAWIFNPVYAPGLLPVLAALFALPAIYAARLIYPPPENDGLCLTGCDYVLQVGILPYAILNMITLSLIRDLFELGDPLKVAVGYCAMVVLAVLFVLNIYWAGTDPRKTLDERPDLGYAYEATMILLPFATLVICLRLSQPHVFGG